MKKAVIFILMGLGFAYLYSCGCGSEKIAEKMQKEIVKKAAGVSEEEYDQAMDKVKQIAKNAEEMEAEGDDGKILSDKNLGLLGLTATDRKIPDSAWEKAIVLKTEYRALSNEELRALTPEKIEKMIKNSGFSDLSAGKKSLTDISDSSQFILDVQMKIGMLKTTRLMDGEDAYKKEMKELGGKINERGYSAEDLTAMDENVKVAAAVTEIMYRLNR